MNKICHPNHSFEDTNKEPIFVEFWHRPIPILLKSNGQFKSERIKFWVEWIKEGKEIPPLFVCYHTGDERSFRSGGKNWYVHDGTHRLSALRYVQTLAISRPKPVMGFHTSKEESSDLSCWAMECLTPEQGIWEDMSTWGFTGRMLRVK